MVDQSLAAGFIPINTRQQRASLPFKPGVLEKKVYNNEDITFFSVLKFATCVIMRCSPHHFAVPAATHYHTRAWQTLIHGKEYLILLFIHFSTF